MKLQRLYSLARKAIDTYQMIDNGDHIAVGISGGKDSLTLLYALNGIMKFYPQKFSLTAITVDLGFGSFDLSSVSELCEEFSIPYKIISTDIGKILFQERQESNPCSLCAKLRKGALNKAAKDLGCNKVAYAHHREDLIETMLLSLIYEGRFYAFSPYTYLDRMDLTVIRPLMLVPEADIKGFQKKYELPVCKNPCPMDGHTKREYAKTLMNTLEKENPGAKTRLFHAIVSGNIPGWPVCSPTLPLSRTL
ncbi:tRNA 2-thiocytidine biosynthesis protein TtcA [Clostridiaceae bacterium]|nr:tRNA 2-thiocytidine biosynthesis protein TtcA [Clostridiaceae bacterium]RKI13119.1 tRNA 2-thiocytidine biosynthesis protein TtcA [bacterium 1XD21-70]